MEHSPDKAAFLALIQANKRLIYKICNSYCRNPFDREDLAQEIIYQLWKSGDSFSGGVAFTTWMYRIALNTAITYYRKDQRAGRQVELTEQVITMQGPVNDADAEVDEQVKRLQEMINEFNELDRALVLLYLEGKAYREIAEIMGITESNVGTKLARIKERLRVQFARE